MKTINLRAFDLNLLPILHALLEERSVTQASRRVNLSQSAASSALRRLRETFEDPILTRRGQRMILSPKARLIRDELDELMTLTTNVIATLRSCSTMDERTEYSICGPEYVTMTLSDAILRVLIDMCDANVRLEPFNRKLIFDQLERGQVDLALGAFGRIRPCFKRATLFSEHLIVAICKGHAIAAKSNEGAMSLSDFTSYPHLQVTGGDSLEDAWVSKLLSAHRIERQVTAVLPNMGMVPEVLGRTDMLCVGTLRALASLHDAANELTWLELPVELGPRDYEIEMIWHESSDVDCQVLRATILSGSAALRDASQ